MKKLSLVSTILITISTALALTPSQEQLRARLVDGAPEIGVNGVPGELVLFGDGAVPLYNANRNGARVPVVAVSASGAAKAALFAHPGFIMCFADQKAPIGDMRCCFMNILDWMDDGATTHKIAVLKSRDILNSLKALPSVEARAISDVAELCKGEILALYPDDISDATQLEAVRKALVSGVPVIGAGLGWAWQQASSGKSIAEDSPVNRIFADVGICLTPSSAWSEKNRFKAGNKEPEGITVPEAVAMVKSGRELSLSERKQISEVILSAMLSIPEYAKVSIGDLTALISSDAAEVRAPTADRPLTEQDFFSRLALMDIRSRWERSPKGLHHASFAASAYPGVLPKEVKRLKGIKIAIDSGVPRWQSTGLFVSAGEKLTVTIPRAAVEWGLQLRIGTTGDDISGDSEKWCRAPTVSVQIPLTERTTELSTPYGGLVYIVVPENLRGDRAPDPRDGSVARFGWTRVQNVPTSVPDKFEVEISGAARAPMYVRGQTSAKQWAASDFRVPQMELCGKNVIFTLPTVCATNLPPIETVIEFWDNLFDAYAELTDLPPRVSPERICADVQLSSGYMHNGYPIMFHYNSTSGDNPFKMDELRTVGNWGLYHEIGHNHQSADWTWQGSGEVTENILTLYAMEKTTGKTPREVGASTWQEGLGHIRSWVQDGRPANRWSVNPFFSLEFFTRLHDAYGWDGLRKLFASYHDPAFGPRPKNDRDKRDQMALRLSKITGENLATYFDAWRLDISQSTREACAVYPAPKCPTLFTGLLTNNWDIATEAGRKAAQSRQPSDKGFKSGEKILFIGDSITWLSSSGTGFAAQLKKLLSLVYPEEKISVESAGFNGRTVFDWKGMAKDNETLGKGADYVFIMLGMNDLLGPSVRDTPKGRKLWLDTYRDLVRIVKERAKPHTIVLCDITPYMDDKDSAMNRFAASLYSQLDKLAEEEGCLRSHTAARSFEAIDYLRQRGSLASLWSDWVHPRSFEGNAAILMANMEAIGDEPLVAAIKAKQSADLADQAAGGARVKQLDLPRWAMYRVGENFGGSRFPELTVPQCEADFVKGRNLGGDGWKMSPVSPDYPHGANPDAIHFASAFVYSANETYYASRVVESDIDRPARLRFYQSTFLGGPSCCVWVNGEAVGRVTGIDKNKIRSLDIRLKRGENRILIRADFTTWSMHDFVCEID